MRLTFNIIIGLISVIIFIYRLFFVMYPMLSKGWQLKDYVMMLDSLTMLV